MDDVLPEDVFFHHILPRLPRKSLFRFRCVCKSWLSFVFSPLFFQCRKSLIPAAPDDHLLFVCRDWATTCEPKIFTSPLLLKQEGNGDGVSPPRPAHIATIANRNVFKVAAQCVNGILCLHPKDFCLSVAFTYIFNPTTGQTITLPDDPFIGDKFRVSTHLGYDPTGDEFKVLRFVDYDDSYKFRIFTIGDANNNSWRVVTPAPVIDPRKCFSAGNKGVCVNGAIHWRCYSYILAFDLRTEQFRTMNTPDWHRYRGFSRTPDLVELRGCLTFVGYGDDVLKLTMLRDYKTQRWIQERIALPSGFGRQGRTLVPLCSVPKTGEIVLVEYFLPWTVKVFYHDLEKNITRSVKVMRMDYPLWPDQYSGYTEIFFYQENFRSLC